MKKQTRSETAQTEQSAIAIGGRAGAGCALRFVWLALVAGLDALRAVGRLSAARPGGAEDGRAARVVFFQLRLPRVLMAGVVGASLGVVGAALQAMFRNPLAEPLTLGVSGGGALGASVAIAFGLGARVAGLAGRLRRRLPRRACASVLVVYRLARTGATVLPGALLLAGVVMNTMAAAGVVVMQYFADYSRALQILRWTIGSLDIVGFDLIWRMLIFLVPGWVVLLVMARDLHLLAVDEETAAEPRRQRPTQRAARLRRRRRSSSA